MSDIMFNITIGEEIARRLNAHEPLMERLGIGEELPDDERRFYRLVGMTDLIKSELDWIKVRMTEIEVDKKDADVIDESMDQILSELRGVRIFLE